MWRRGPWCMVLMMAVGIGASACTPTFDWREARPDATLLVMFPCKPERHARQVDVQGARLEMTLASCAAGDQTFALSFVDAPDIGRLAPLMQALQATLSTNVSGISATSAASAASVAEPVQVRGATPNPPAMHLSVSGLRPDGDSVRAEAHFFCRGLRIYQATVIGRRLDSQALDAFFTSLTLPS